ncbi:MAG TPA: hypothetical protein VGR57_06720 [Ktedonobacterales bacterium]|nr:hypothetical protein [Ktedonobacterales bacterium]
MKRARTGMEPQRHGHARARGVGGLALLACLFVAACASATTAGKTFTATPPATVAASGTPRATDTPGGPTATPYLSGTPGGQLGTTDACAANATPTASLPHNIPLYPNGDLSIGSVNGDKGVFGFCTADSIAAVDAYYQQQLPAAGWQNVRDNTLDTSHQIVAGQGALNLIITISPDSAVPGKTAVLIIYSGS